MMHSCAPAGHGASAVARGSKIARLKSSERRKLLGGNAARLLKIAAGEVSRQS